MIEWLTDFWQSLTWSRILWGLVASAAAVVVSYAMMIYGLVKIPADYFSSSYVKEKNSDQHFSLRWAGMIGKNVAGFILIIAGIIMIFTPGPGVPTILLGLILMDIPGKRPLEARLIKQPAVLSAINSLRLRYDKPPLILD